MCSPGPRDVLSKVVLCSSQWPIAAGRHAKTAMFCRRRTPSCVSAWVANRQRAAVAAQASGLGHFEQHAARCMQNLVPILVAVARVMVTFWVVGAQVL
mmetsp:Transcript_41827/g.61486  ORF Transcript_41827/g.61486 Transcript_41827/m.61486 type:complete len:98 (-) Transcript_41827:228-521(-)